MTPAPIRDAATIIVVREPETAPAILMGQRGAKAAFMPSKFVFPGGAVDPGDETVTPMVPLPAVCAARLRDAAAPGMDRALPMTALRELWEETGLLIGRPGAWPDAPPDWAGFARAGARPDASTLAFIFRAITPPGRPRRFDARFFAAPATAVLGDPDDFSQASEELSNLQWIPLRDARRFDLPFITEVVLAELAAALPALGAPQTVPFYRNDDEESAFLRLGGQALADRP